MKHTKRSYISFTREPVILSNFAAMRSRTGFHYVIMSFVLLLLGVRSGYGQTISVADTSRKIIQFSGIVVDADSLNTLPFVAVVIRGTERGVFGNANGYYSIVVQEKDTIDFFGLGYHTGMYVVPDTFSIANQYNHVQSLKLDTILLREAVIYPWPSKERFKNAFLAMDVPTDDLDRARRNLARADLVQAAQDVAMDGGMAAAATQRQQVSRNYYAGQLQPNNLLNPVAWSRFLQSLHNGDLKRQ